MGVTRVNRFCSNSPALLSAELAKAALFLEMELNLEFSSPSKDVMWCQGVLELKALFFPSASLPVTLRAISQTISYSAFLQKLACAENSKSRFNFLRQGCQSSFLGKVFSLVHSEGVPLRVERACSAVENALGQCDFSEFRKSFFNSGRGDPSLYFFEDFLNHADPEARKRMGVYFTPGVVADFMIRICDGILLDTLGSGLSSRDYLVLDPACGSGVFLNHVVRHLHANWTGSCDEWNLFVREHLLPRLCGFEIMTSSYASAHIHLLEALSKTGFQSEEFPAPSVFLTDTLEQTARRSLALAEGFESRDSLAAADIESSSCIPVILGNPPYRQFSENKGEWIDSLMSDYKSGLVERKHNVDNDYAKFIRFAEWRVEKAGKGAIAFITPNTHLDAPTFRVMRAHLLETFDDIYVVNLHGSVNVETEASVNQGGDENIFDIRQGVCLSFLIKSGKKRAGETARVHYFSIQGTREQKFSEMQHLSLATIPWQTFQPQGEQVFFVPTKKRGEKRPPDLGLPEIFAQRSSGIQTKNDALLVAKTRDEMLERIDILATCSEEEVRQKFPNLRESSGWTLSRAMTHARQIQPRKAQSVQRVLYRPFEERWTVLTDEGTGLVGRPRFETMKLFFGENELKNFGLVTTRQLSSQKFSHAWVSRLPVDGNAISQRSREYNVVFPLFVDDGIFGFAPNLTPHAIQKFEESTGLVFSECSERDPKRSFDALDLFSYVYAVLWCPEYRERENEELKRDFARIPLPKGEFDFRKWSESGLALVQLHAPVSGKKFASGHSTRAGVFHSGANKRCMKVRYHSESSRVEINDSSYFENVSPAVWDFRIGAFDVCRKWLSDREFSKTGRDLDDSEILQFANIVAMIQSTLDQSRGPRIREPAGSFDTQPLWQGVR
jgi:predicted helicase